MNRLLADAILVAHFGFVLFVVGGFLLILVGAACGWSWIRSPRFRYLHLAAIAFVALESLVGIACPLTVWEDALRQATPAHPSFIGRWFGRLLYYDFPPWVFAAAYLAFAATVAAMLKWIPSRRMAGRGASGPRHPSA